MCFKVFVTVKGWQNSMLVLIIGNGINSRNVVVACGCRSLCSSDMLEGSAALHGLLRHGHGLFLLPGYSSSSKDTVHSLQGQGVGTSLQDLQNRAPAALQHSTLSCRLQWVKAGLRSWAAGGREGTVKLDIVFRYNGWWSSTSGILYLLTIYSDTTVWWDRGYRGLPQSSIPPTQQLPGRIGFN